MVKAGEKKLTLACKHLSNLTEIAAQILRISSDCRAFLLIGNLGAGKTTLIKELCLQLGVQEAVKSPTFSIINEYSRDNGSPVYHFDFYRIKSEAEGVALGLDEYFFSGHYCFLEWPEIIARLIPDRYVKIAITVPASESRIFEIDKHE